MQVEEEEDDVDSDGYETVKPKKRYNKRNWLMLSFILICLIQIN